jgi:copper transport protein
VLDSASKPCDVPEVTATLHLTTQGLGPLPLTLRKVAPGDYATEGLVISIAGTWTMQIKVRMSDFDQITVEAQLPVH